MNEYEWDTCVDPSLMLSSYADDRERAELGLFGCACCRRLWHLLSDERLRRGIEVRERHERGLASKEEVDDAVRGARIARREARAPFIYLAECDEHAPEVAAGWAAGAASNAAIGNYYAASELAARAKACADAGDWQRSYETERAAQCDLLRSMVANPFHSE